MTPTWDIVERPRLTTYRAFGLNISSEIECADLRLGLGEPDVNVRLGSVPERLQNPVFSGVFYQGTSHQFVLNFKSVARYLVTGGNEVIVDIAPGAETAMVQLLLCGAVFGALLNQRRILTLHASAIGTPEGAVVFAGPTGIGKSTLAASFHRRGYPVLSDEMCALGTAGFPQVLPAHPFLMLWADVVEKLSLNETALRRARSDLEKYVLPLGPGFGSEALPLLRIYLIEATASTAFTLLPMRGLDKIKTIQIACYKPWFVRGMDFEKQHSGKIMEVARHTQVSVISRPSGGFQLDELTDLLAEDLAL